MITSATTMLERCYGTTRRAIPTAGRPSLHAVSEKSLRPRDPGEGPLRARSARTGVRAHSIAVLSGVTEHPLQAGNKAARPLSVNHLIGGTDLTGGRPWIAVLAGTARRTHTRARLASRATFATCAIS